MKKVLALVLALVMTFGLVACGGNDNTKVEVPENALVILETVWNSYAEEEKFFIMGGDASEENMKDGAPGKFNVADEGMTYTLLVPADQVANVTDAASMVHAMMLNNFTCGAFRVSGDAKAFGDAMYTAISTNQWMCGMPEQLLIAVVGGEYVVAAFGLADLMSTFESKLTAAYPGTEIVKSEAIG